MSGAEGSLRIAVPGGSIGGLCAGLALRGAGFDVRVYERVSGPMETRGAGIVVQGELIHLLRTHGAGVLPTTHCTVRRYLSPEAVKARGNARPRTSPRGRRSITRSPSPFPPPITIGGPRQRI